MGEPEQLHESVEQVENPTLLLGGIESGGSTQKAETGGPPAAIIDLARLEAEDDRPRAEQVFLLGRPPLPEFLGFVVQTGAATQADLPRLAEEWRAANDRVLELQVTECGFADSPTIAELPPALQSLAMQAISDPVFQRSFGLVPARLGLIELDKLVVFQKHIDLVHVGRLQGMVRRRPTDAEIFRVCFQIEEILPPTHAGQLAPNTWGFVSRSTDYRVLEARLVEASEAPSLVTSGRPTHVLMIPIGFGSNYLNVIHVEDRLILNNGSHRAYALRELGVTHAPCVIQEVTRREELPLLLNPELVQNIDTYLKVARPATLKDYFDAALVKRLPMSRRDTQVRVSVGVEALTMPASEVG